MILCTTKLTGTSFHSSHDIINSSTNSRADDSKHSCGHQVHKSSCVEILGLFFKAEGLFRVVVHVFTYSLWERMYDIKGSQQVIKAQPDTEFITSEAKWNPGMQHMIATGLQNIISAKNRIIER